MKLSAPKQIVWIISLILGVLAVLSMFVAIPIIGPYAFWVLAIAWLLLILGTLLAGL